MTRSLSTLAVIAMPLLAAACATRHPTYAVTEQSHPFSAMDAAQTGSAPPVAQRVTAERLRAARSEPQNWLTYYGAYDGQRYSALDQITTANVRGLKPAWVFQVGVIGLIATPASFAFEAAPVIVDGVMYVTAWDGYLFALDAATGTQLWRYRHAVPLDVPLCCGNVNRGAAVARGKVFFATPHGHVVALDAATGRQVWDQPFVDPRAGESATMAPLVVKNLVIVGSSGGEYGVRGHIDAFDVETGRRVWRRYTIPKPGEPGSETWPKNDAWAKGGGTAWITGTYDPDLDLLYWGTGNPGADFDASDRPGANLYTNSVLALDPDDGSIRWHYQFTPNDVWDFDGVNENILLDRDGRKLLAHFDRNGFLYVLDRTNGRLVRTVKFSDRVTWGDVHPTTGAVTVRMRPTREGVKICPSASGAKEWPHAAYNPTTGLLYVPVIEKCGTFKTSPQEFREGMAYWGGEARADTSAKDSWGYVRAIDPVTGREAWAHRTEHPMVASVLATAGGVVFAGDPTGEALGLDARTGEVLWRFQTGSGIHSNPVTYSVNGKQYVAIPTGWGGWMKGFAPELYGQNRGSALFAFALP